MDCVGSHDVVTVDGVQDIFFYAKNILNISIKGFSLQFLMLADHWVVIISPVITVIKPSKISILETALIKSYLNGRTLMKLLILF